MLDLKAKACAIVGNLADCRCSRTAHLHSHLLSVPSACLVPRAPQLLPLPPRQRRRRRTLSLWATLAWTPALWPCQVCGGPVA
jgi:hypothetical protein